MIISHYSFFVHVQQTWLKNPGLPEFLNKLVNPSLMPSRNQGKLKANKKQQALLKKFGIYSGDLYITDNRKYILTRGNAIIRNFEY